jgi:GTPase SAR1 family protein
VRGQARTGKSTTIDAMAGKEFDAQHPSTVGADMHSFELERRDLAVGDGGGALVSYEGAADEHARALAAHAAMLGAKKLKEKDKRLVTRVDAATMASMLDALRKRHEGGTSNGHGEGSNSNDAAAPAPAPAPAVAAPAVANEALPLDLIIKYQTGELRQKLVLRVQDTGGQPVFLSMLEMLTTPDGTV